MANGETARKAALGAMLAVWHARVAGGVQSSPQAHCEALLDAAMTGLYGAGGVLAARSSDSPAWTLVADGLDCDVC